MFLDLSRSGLNRGRCFFWNLWATISDVSGLSQYNGRDLLLRLHNENKTWFNDSKHFWSRNILSLRAQTCINIYNIVDHLMDMTLQIKSPTYRQIYKGITHRRGPAMTIAANQRGSRLLEESSTKIGVEKYSYWYFCHDTTWGCMNSQKLIIELR